MSTTRDFKTVTRYAITHINADGMRQLSFPNQGRYHRNTREEAQRAMDEIFANGTNSRDTLLSVFGGQAGVDSLQVRPVECYEHGDAIRIYFDEDEAPAKPTHGAPVPKNIPGDMQAVPPVPCEFKVGDAVTYTNDQEVVFENKKVIGFTKEVTSWGAFIYYAPSDSWWHPVKPGNLKKAGGVV